MAILQNTNIVHLASYKRTKIIATVGPSTSNYEDVLGLVKAGANAIRINFSNGTYQEHKDYINKARKATKETNKPIAVIEDLQGPRIRLGDFEGVILVAKNQLLRFRYNADYERESIIPVQYDISKKVKRGQRLYIYDGKIKTTIESVKDNIVYAKAESEGVLIARKGINLPDTDFEGDIITDKDRADIIFGAENDVDYIAMSFVQNAEDIRQVRRLIKNSGGQAKIIAKIETRAATDNIEQIVNEADVIMVARGDLAVETNAEAVPIIQRQIIELGLEYGKPTIVATQMLASMTDHTEPTRAEVNDIASAVIMGADALMLSEETAIGKNPIDSVKTMKKIIKYTESSGVVYDKHNLHLDAHSKQGAISEAIIRLAKNINADAIVAETKSGGTALKIASYRPRIPIVSVTSSKRVSQQLAIVFGTKNYIRKDEQKQATQLASWLHKQRVLKRGNTIVIASGQHPGVVGTTDTIKVRVIE